MSMFAVTGGFTGLAMSSRVRLARNLKGYPFALRANKCAQVAQKVFAVLRQNPAIGNEFEQQTITPNSRQAAQMVERHLISPALAQKGGYVILSKDEAVSLMIGEEDHLRLQVIGEGLCPKECLQTARRLADLIEQSLPFAYDERYGYLTACPSNVGTGLRASVMLHLPMLTQTGGLERIVGFAGSRGCAVRGAYGEGSKAVGSFYQLSNQVTLGSSAEELTDRLVETATMVMDTETRVREQVRTQKEAQLRDRIWRAAGTLRTAWLIQTDEAIACLSDVLMGLQMGMLGGVEPHTLYRLESQIQPAMLSGTAEERDQKRACLLREATKTLNFVE